MQKSKKIITLKNTLIIFVIIAVYCVLKSFDMTESGLYALFIGDFSIGFCSRFLIGSILSIFKDSFTVEWITSFLRIFTFAVFLVTAYYFGSVITATDKNKTTTLVILTAVFIACPFSLTVYAGDIFGFIDVFCYAVLLLTVFFVNNRILIWSLPVLFVAGVFIHDCYITAYMAPCLGVLAYYVIKKYGKKIWASAIFIVSALGCAAASVYSVLFAKYTVKMTENEVTEYLAAKGNIAESEVSWYIHTFLFYKDPVGMTEKTHADNIWELLKYMIVLATDSFRTEDLICFMSIIPVIAIIFMIWIKAIKNSSSFMEKVPYILFMLTPVPQIASLFISNDFTRFLSTIVITQMLYLFMCVKQNDASVGIGMDIVNQKKHYLIPPCLSVFLMNI